MEPLSDRSSTRLHHRLRWLQSLAARRWGGAVSLERRLAGLDIHRLDVVDCGCGLSDTVVSRQVLRLPFNRLVGVDGFPAVVELARRQPCRARQRELLCLPLSALAAHYGRREAFDLALCFDVLEHFEKDAALRFLADLETIIRRRIILWLPLGNYRVDADPHGRGNPLELHRSFWAAGELAALGYAVEILPRFHHARYDALWAIKNVGS